MINVTIWLYVGVPNEFTIENRNERTYFPNFLPPDCHIQITRRPRLDLLGRIVTARDKMNGRKVNTEEGRLLSWQETSNMHRSAHEA